MYESRPELKMQYSWHPEPGRRGDDCAAYMLHRVHAHAGRRISNFFPSDVRAAGHDACPDRKKSARGRIQDGSARGRGLHPIRYIRIIFIPLHLQLRPLRHRGPRRRAGGGRCGCSSKSRRRCTYHTRAKVERAQ